MKKTDHIGRWAVCQVGRVGRIEEVKHTIKYGQTAFWATGTKLDGSPWSSYRYRVINDEDAEALGLPTAEGE